MQEIIVKTNNLCVAQNSKLLIENANIELRKGELIYLIGKVGCGKTSLIKTMYADLPLKSGSLQVNGFDLDNISAKQIPLLRRSLGIVFQDFKLLNDRTVFENLSFVLEATDWKHKDAIKKRVSDVLDTVNLSDKQAQMPNELSGGEQQRVVIARALLNAPPLILADEPTGNLDPDSSENIMKILQSITQNGSCVLIATHQYNLIQAFPGRILKIENKKLIELDKLN